MRTKEEITERKHMIAEASRQRAATKSSGLSQQDSMLSRATLVAVLHKHLSNIEIELERKKRHRKHV